MHRHRAAPRAASRRRGGVWLAGRLASRTRNFLRCRARDRLRPRVARSGDRSRREFFPRLPARRSFSPRPGRTSVKQLRPTPDRHRPRVLLVCDDGRRRRVATPSCRPLLGRGLRAGRSSPDRHGRRHRRVPAHRVPSGSSASSRREPQQRRTRSSSTAPRSPKRWRSQGHFSAGEALLDLIVGARVARLRLAMRLAGPRGPKRIDDPLVRSPSRTAARRFLAYVRLKSSDSPGSSRRASRLSSGLQPGRTSRRARAAANASGVVTTSSRVLLFILIGLQFPGRSRSSATRRRGRSSWPHSAWPAPSSSSGCPFAVIAVRLPVRERVIVGWAGMRGAVSLAAALAFPVEAEVRPRSSSHADHHRHHADPPGSHPPAADRR
jgi:hypothetical protein